MTLIEVIESEFYYLLEAIEHGCSDKSVTDKYISELFEKTGYKY